MLVRRQLRKTDSALIRFVLTHTAIKITLQPLCHMTLKTDGAGLSEKLKKIIALTLVALMTCLSVNTAFSVAHEVGEAGFSQADKITMGSLQHNTSGHCPVCPADNHSSTDHEHFSCDHHSYMFVAAQTAYRHPASTAVSLVNLEKFQFIPEVFLSIDTPPHNLA